MDERDLTTVLQCCLNRGHKADWEIFIKAVQPIIAGVIRRTVWRLTQPDQNLVDDLVQETFLKLLKNDLHVLRSFRGTDTNSLYVYLKTIASSIAIDYFRLPSTQRAVSGLDQVASLVAIEENHFLESERRMLLDHVERCLADQEPRNRQLFWLYHRQGLTPKVISSLPGINMGVSGVETAVYRLTKAVRDCVRRATSKPAVVPEVGQA